MVDVENYMLIPYTDIQIIGNSYSLDPVETAEGYLDIEG